jgi:UDP-N-acetylmuramoyl-L-alanyl-D-glutamate--2,6-diaminopimelate ligase
MKLNLLLKGIGNVTLKGDRHINIESISHNSKQVRGQALFFAIKGVAQNGYDFIDEAIERGAVCVVSEEDFITYKNITKVLVDDIRKACAAIASNFYNHPSGRMNITGITGTNGKTTILYMVSHIMKCAGMKCGMIGTINYSIGPRLIPATNTTPSSIMLQMFLSEMENAGIGNCAMEVSSHALDQNRVDAILFDRAIFTNLTSEHLDYHKNMEEYFHAKMKLFSMLKEGGLSIINIDDQYGRLIADGYSSRKLTYGIKTQLADISAFDIKKTAHSTNFKVNVKDRKPFPVESPLIGEYNIYNMLAAISWAISVGLSPEVIKAAMESFQPAPGRMERIGSVNTDIAAFVDYAHTEDALLNALKALNEVKQRKIITVFGCGGDRDKKKRPKMGKAASDFSDYVIITSDNPRTENPEKIIQDIKKGIPEGFVNFKVIIDRKKAIEYSLDIAEKDDIVLVAGKGHESYQVLMDTTVAFDDRKVVYDTLEKLSKTEKVS